VRKLLKKKEIEGKEKEEENLNHFPGKNHGRKRPARENGEHVSNQATKYKRGKRKKSLQGQRRKKDGNKA